MKTKALIVLSLMVLIVFSSISINVSKAAAVPAIYVLDVLTQSGVTGAGVGETFTVDVRVRNVQYLMAFEFYMQWNDTLLQFISATEGPFLNSTSAYRSIYVAKYPGYAAGWPYSNKTYVEDALIAATQSSSASGTGTLARFTFKVLVEGACMLDLQESTLVGYSAFSPPPEIIHTSEDGYFTTASIPRVVVEPAEVVGTLPGESFSVNISAFDVLNVYNWTVVMKWRADLLNATDIVEGSFLSDAGATNFMSAVDQDNGVLYVNNTLTGAPLDGVSGSGTLATITFLAEIRGKTDLQLYTVKLYEQDGSVSPVAVESGSFSNTLRDVSITDASLSTNSVSQGQKVDITVTVKNNGLENETFTVRVDFDSQAVEPAKAVNKLVPTATQTLTFQWDTSNVEPKEYTLKAVIVETIPGEVNKADNTRTIGTVTVSGGGFDYNLLLIGGAIAAVVVVALAVFFVRKRK